MNHIRNNIKDNFAQIPNALINDNTLSDRARFIFCYMAAKSDDWKFYQDKMAKDLKMSVDTVRKYIAELLESGWLTREEVRGERGVFDSFIYDLHPAPCRKNTESVKNGVGKNPSPLNSALTNTIPLQTKNINNKEEKKVVESSSTPFLDQDEVEEIEQQIYHSKTTEKKERKSSAKKKEKSDDPTPIRAMFDLYADKYAELNNGVKPEFMVKYTPAMKNLYGILRSRSITSGFVPLDNMEPWRDFLTAWADYLAKNEKEKWHRDNFNPLTFFSQFNSIIAKLNNRPKTDAEKWIEWGKRQGL